MVCDTVSGSLAEVVRSHHVSVVMEMNTQHRRVTMVTFNDDVPLCHDNDVE